MASATTIVTFVSLFSRRRTAYGSRRVGSRQKTEASCLGDRECDTEPDLAPTQRGAIRAVPFVPPSDATSNSSAVRAFAPCIRDWWIDCRLAGTPTTIACRRGRVQRLLAY